LSLIVLRPVAIAVSAFAAWGLTRDQILRHRFAFAMMAAVFALTILHLVPLPPAIWSALPGREILVQIDAAAAIGPIWRPLSVAPAGTVNAFFSLFIPLAVLLLGVRLSTAMQHRLLLIVVLIGLFSALLGLLQLLGSPTGPLYLYRNTNYGVATGLFANRNHQAIFLATLLPMLAALAMSARGTPKQLLFSYGALISGAFLLPLLLITGSRIGIMTGALGLLSVPFLMRFDKRKPASPKQRKGPGLRLWRWLSGPRGLVAMGATFVAVLAGLTIWLSRAASVTRVVDAEAGDELRFKVWPVIFDNVTAYFPLGSGIGSFVPVFKIVEPDAILRPTYLNHAHNDPLEVLLTAGIPGALLMVAAVVAWAIAARRAFSGSLADPNILFARTGVIVIGLLGIGSLTDYPLRTPFLAALLVVAALWSSRVNRNSSKRDNASAAPIRAVRL